MPGDPDQYLEGCKDELSTENWEALRQFRKEASIADNTIYDYLSRMKNILLTCAPDENFMLADPSKDEILELANNIEDEKSKSSTQKTWLKSVKKFYKVYNGGEYYDLTDCFTVARKGTTETTVEPDMILTPSEVQDIVNNAKNVRDKAYIRLLYETATTPGELLQAKLKDVDLTEETIYVRGNKRHRSQTMELHNEGVHYLREYLKSHPAVDDPFFTTSDTPLWIKMGAVNCSNCGKSQSQHSIDNGVETCDNFSPDNVEKVGYRPMNKAFNKAVERSDIERDIKAKYLRKSMLSRIAPDVGYEQLNNFARWRPGSSQAQHYISISNEKLRNMVKEQFKGEADTDDWIICENCNSRNNPDNIECKKCHRPLNVAKSQKMERANELVERLSKLDDEKLDKVEENMDLLENPEEFINEKIEEKLQEAAE